MAGILLYTAAPNAERTLGGLVSLCRPEFAGPVLARALRRMSLYAPPTQAGMCANHCPGEHEDVLHGAACHAYLFVPETPATAATDTSSAVLSARHSPTPASASRGAGDRWLRTTR